MIRALHPIRHDNKEFKRGALIEGLSKKDEERLVRLNAAEYVISPEEELKKQKVQGNNVQIPPEEFETLSKELDGAYNKDELIHVAKEVGVDLTGASTKAEIIAAIINQGKVDEFLEDDDNDDSDADSGADTDGQ